MLVRLVLFFSSYLMLFYFRYLCSVAATKSDIIVYTHLTGYHLHTGLIEEIPCDHSVYYCSLTRCTGQCRCLEDCLVINYNTQTGLCQLHDSSVLYSKDYDTGESQWVVLEPQTAPPKFGEWTMVFRITSAINVSAHDTYTDSSRQDDRNVIASNIPVGCTTIDGSLPCDRHFRSSYLDTWTTRNFSEVLVAMYSHGEMISNVTFDAAGSDVKSWFTASRVLTSSWDDLLEVNQTYNVFGVDGHDPRRFMMNEHYGGCASDRGWMVVVDTPLGRNCSWEQDTVHFPTLITSTEPGSANWHTERIIADVMAIMVKN